jgi:nucleotide-binding universal stress UspA family protein
MKRIVVPTDFSKEAERAFAPTAAMAKALGLGIVLLHVVREPVMLSGAAPGAAMPIPQPDIRGQREAAERQLREMRHHFEGLDVATEVRVSAVPAQTIADYAKEIGAASIAIATHGRSGIRRLVLGSVAENVLRRARCPVICYPAG